MSPEEQNETFIIEGPEKCPLLEDKVFDQKGKGFTCTMMNYWTRKAIKYPTDSDTFLSEDALKVLKKVEPNKGRNEEIS
jgi:hypothetical protein